MEDKNAWQIILVVIALFVIFVEPYYAVQTFANYLVVAGFFAVIGLAGVSMILYGLFKFIFSGEAIHIQIGVMLIVFVALISQLPIL